MTVEQFDPSTSNSAQSQTTTLEIPSKMIAEQSETNKHVENKAKIGFLSLGCPKAEG
jgi:ribosomal protein S12 methylthiotransferase